MFFIDGKQPPKDQELFGRGGEHGPVLTAAQLGTPGKQSHIRGTMFPYGQTGVASLGDGSFYFSHDGGNREEKSYFTNLYKYVLVPENETVFSKIEE